jgi:RNA 3'-terminal phosphate cyclase
VPAHAVGKEVGEMLLNQLYHGGCVDDFLQDQVIINITFLPAFPSKFEEDSSCFEFGTVHLMYR